MPDRTCGHPSTIVAVGSYFLCLYLWNRVCSMHYQLSTAERKPVVPFVSVKHRMPPRLQAPMAAQHHHLHVSNASKKVLQEPTDVIHATATASSMAATSNSAKPASATASANCPRRQSYHTLLTTQATTYQAWQSRIMYYHWKKQAAAAGPCTDMTGFTRLVASKNAEPDGLEVEIPSFFVREYTATEIAKYGHFGWAHAPRLPPSSTLTQPAHAQPARDCRLSASCAPLRVQSAQPPILRPAVD